MNRFLSHSAVVCVFLRTPNARSSAIANSDATRLTRDALIGLLALMCGICLVSTLCPPLSADEPVAVEETVPQRTAEPADATEAAGEETTVEDPAAEDPAPGETAPGETAPGETATTPNPDPTVPAAEEPAGSDEDAKVKREFEKFAAEIRAELKKRMEASSRGLEILKECGDEYRDEYRQLGKQLDTLPESDSANDIQRNRLLNRKKAVAIHIWQTQALEPFVSSGAVATQDLQEKLFRYMGGNPKLVEQLGDKFNELQQEISTAQEGAMRGMHRMDRDNMQFHDMTSELDRDLLGKVPAEDNSVTPRPQYVLEMLCEPLQRILQLKWKGERIELDRAHWGDLFGGTTVVESRQHILDQLAKQKIVIDQDNHFPFSHMMQDNPSHLMLLVQNLQYELNRRVPNSMGSGFSGSSEEFQTTFETTDVRVRLDNAKSRFEMIVTEALAPNRTVELMSSSDGTLRVAVLGDEVTMLIQRPSGKVQILQTFDDQSVHTTAASFLELYVKHTDVVENLMVAFDEIGISRPALRFDPEIADQVLRRLQLKDIEGEFARLLADLDSLDFERRDAASRALERDVEIYVSELRKVARESEPSLELRVRVERLLEIYTMRHQHADELVALLGLLDDPIYLANLMPKRVEADRPLLAARLEKLTGEAYGTDPAAWREWLAKQPRP